MAFSLFSTLALFSVLLVLKPVFCLNSEWQSANATWHSFYRVAHLGNACGYEMDQEKSPFFSMVSDASRFLFKSGKGCGSCYQVKCMDMYNKACSGKPISVVITDKCLGSQCYPSADLDLSETAFGAMALSGKESELRKASVLHVQYKRVQCNYPGVSIAFKVWFDSEPNDFATVIKYVAGDGVLSAVELKQTLNSSAWLAMERLEGAVWRINSISALRAPFSFRLTSADSGDTVVANSVIPAGWKPSQTFRSSINFKS